MLRQYKRLISLTAKKSIGQVSKFMTLSRIDGTLLYVLCTAQNGTSEALVPCLKRLYHISFFKLLCIGSRPYLSYIKNFSSATASFVPSSVHHKIRTPKAPDFWGAYHTPLPSFILLYIAAALYRAHII